MMWKTLPVLLGLVAGGAFTLPASGSSFQPPAKGDEAPIATTEKEAGKTWSPVDLSQFSLGPGMASVVSDIVGIEADEWGVTMMSSERAQEQISHVSIADLRASILAETAGENTRKAIELADFAGTKDRAATCAAVGTAGWGGYDQCVEKCGNKRRRFQRVTSHEGACFVLCELAVDPCTNNWAWIPIPKKWKQKTRGVLTRLVPASAASLKESIVGFKNLVLTQALNADPGSWLVLLLLLTIAVRVGRDYREMSALRSRGRRAEINLAAGKNLTSDLRQSHVFLPLKKKGRQFGLYANHVVSWEDHQGISKAKIDAARRWEARISLAEALASAVRKSDMASSFARWKGAKA